MQKNYNENLVAGAAIRDDKGRRISKLFEASHPKMTVGYAKNLIMPDDPTEQEFNFRQSGGGVIEDGVAVIDKVKGKSVVWNQMVKIQLAKTRIINGITFTKNPDRSITASGTATANAVYVIPCDSMVAAHRYLFCASNNGSLSTYGFEVANKTEDGAFEFDYNLFNPTIITPSKNGIEVFFALRAWAGATVNVIYRPQSIDLTQMFGAGNEPTTYEEFLRRKPKVADEYAYNEGTIVNNKVEKVVTTGRNIWDEEWENGYIDVNHGGADEPLSTTFRSKNYTPIPSEATLYVNRGSYNTSLTIAEYNAKKEYIRFKSISSNGTIKMPSDVAFIRFCLEPNANTSIYKNDICINLSDPTINGKYFPYEKHTLDLSWVKEIKDEGGVALFEDGMKSAGTVFDEAGKNKAVKRLGSIDLGTLTPSGYSTLDKRVYYNGITYIKNNGYLVYPKGLKGNISSSSPEWNILFSDGILYIRVDNYTGSADFKAAMSGVLLIYELAKPIEVEYDEKNLTYPVVAGGTEEAIASEPSSAFRADIGYGIDAVKTILDLKARVEALEGK